jgi:flagellar secretion chaperone FliS
VAIADQYLETQVLTAPPEQLHMLVVDGALRFARLGMQSINEQDYDIAHESLSRSREFVNELIVGLSPEGEEDLTDNLRALFRFVHRSLIEADSNRDATSAEAAIDILEQHRQTWKELLDKLTTEQTISSPPPPHQAMSTDDGSEVTERPSVSWLT